MQILKESFEEAYGKVADDIARDHYLDSNEEMEQYTFMFQAKFDPVVDLEDELANVEIGKLLKNELGKITLANQVIEFKTKNSKTLKPMLGNTEIKGSLKKKFLATLNFGTNTEEVEMYGKYFTKQTFQYGSLAVAYFMEDWQMNKGFFMRVKTSKINRTTRKRQYDGDRFAYTQETNDEIAILEEEIYRLKELLKDNDISY